MTIKQANELLKEQIIKDFYSFVIAMVPDYDFNWHHIEIIAKLQELAEKLERGETTKLMVLMPPRSGKSLLISQLFPAWLLARKHGLQVLATSYNQSLSNHFGRIVKRFFESDIFLTVFGVRLSKDAKATANFDLSNRSKYVNSGVGASLTGLGFHLGIVDDPYKNYEDAKSKTYQEKLWDWYGSTFLTRKMDHYAIIFVQTIWTYNDISQKILALEDDWKILKYPAINEKNEALWPSKYPLKEMLKTKKVLGSRAFAALYQQDPLPDEGSIIKKDWINYYTIMPEKFDTWFMSWDLAFKEGKTNDYTVGTVMATKGADIYIIDVVRRKMDFPDTIREFLRLHKQYPQAIAKLVEEKANGAALISSLKRDVSGIIPINPDRSKEVRTNAVAPIFESGNVYFPSSAPWLDDCVEELIRFPFAKHDDFVDTITQGIEHAETLNATIPKEMADIQTNWNLTGGKVQW